MFRLRIPVNVQVHREGTLVLTWWCVQRRIDPAVGAIAVARRQLVVAHACANAAATGWAGLMMPYTQQGSESQY